MNSALAYLPYVVGLTRWLIFLLLKVVPAIFYRPYTSKTLERDIKRHALLMRRGWYLRFRTGTLGGLGGGAFGVAMANLSAWLVDEAAYHKRDAAEMIFLSLVLGFIPGFFAIFFFAFFMESVNIRARREFMRDILFHRTKGFSKLNEIMEDENIWDGSIPDSSIYNGFSELNEIMEDQSIWDSNIPESSIADSSIYTSSYVASHEFPSGVSISNHPLHGREENGDKDTVPVEVDEHAQDDPFGLVEPVLFTPSDVTVVVPVYEPPPAFKANIASLINNKPAKIYIVADITCVDKVLAIAEMLNGNHDLVEVIPEPKPGKRAALSDGLMAVRSRLCCFVDDDCQWCDNNYLYNLIKPFNNRTIGAVGSKQIMRPGEEPPVSDGDHPLLRKSRILEIMADFRLSARYIDLMATTAVDRGASCVSGRTMCFRTEAIEEEAFHHAFMHEKLFGIHLLSGDDKFLTRYIINKGYKTYHQLQKG